MIRLNGGPEAFIKNLSQLLFNNNFSISIILSNDDKKNAIGFDSRVDIYSINNTLHLFFMLGITI